MGTGSLISMGAMGVGYIYIERERETDGERRGGRGNLCGGNGGKGRVLLY